MVFLIVIYLPLIILALFGAVSGVHNWIYVSLFMGIFCIPFLFLVLRSATKEEKRSSNAEFLTSFVTKRYRNNLRISYRFIGNRYLFLLKFLFCLCPFAGILNMLIDIFIWRIEPITPKNILIFISFCIWGILSGGVVKEFISKRKYTYVYRHDKLMFFSEKKLVGCWNINDIVEIGDKLERDRRIRKRENAIYSEAIEKFSESIIHSSLSMHALLQVIKDLQSKNPKS